MRWMLNNQSRMDLELNDHSIENRRKMLWDSWEYWEYWEYWFWTLGVFVSGLNLIDGTYRCQEFFDCCFVK